MRSRRLMLTACVAAAIAIGGCGEISNTIVPRAGSTTRVKLELAGPPNALYAGIYNAIALGYYKQSAMNVVISSPSAGQDPLTMVHNFKTEIAVSSEPNVLLRRNENVPVVAVGAIVQKPLASVQVTLPKKQTKTKTKTRKCTTEKCKKKTTTTKSSTTTTKTLKDIWKPGAVGEGGTSATTNLVTPKDAIKLLERSDTPTYQGLVFAVRRISIVNNAPVLRRFLQTAARGYEAARKNPEQAVNNMIREVPSLAGQKAQLLATLKAFLPDMFPPIPTKGLEKGKPQPWGFQDETEWNEFGNWLHIHKLISDPQAVTDASTNELLAGKGV